MSVARTARRRRKQAVMGYTHIAKLGRPIYRKPDTDAQRKKAAEKLQAQRDRQARGAKF